MVKLQFEKLEPIKLPLLQRFYKLHYPSAKPKKDELLIIARCNSEICAAVRFRRIENYRLLTGMAVHLHYRGRGIAHQLLDHCQTLPLDPDVYCFAFAELANFYQQHGFSIIDENILPASLKKLYDSYTNGGKSLIAMQFIGKIFHN